MAIKYRIAIDLHSGFLQLIEGARIVGTLRKQSLQSTSLSDS